MLRRWLRTVFSLILRAAAISLLLSPRATRSRTSSSRDVRPSSPWPSRVRRPNSSTTLVAMAGESGGTPLPARRGLSYRSSGAGLFQRLVAGGGFAHDLKSLPLRQERGQPLPE